MRLNLIEIIFTSVYISVSIKLACYNFTSLKIDMLMCSMDSSWRIQTMLQESGNPSSGNPRGWPYAFGQWYKSMIKGYRVYQVTNSSLFYYCPQKTKYSCNWCKDWQSKTRVFLLTRQMLALTATVLTVLKATTQDQCVLCVCCYLLMVIMMRKYAFNLELIERKIPSLVHLKYDTSLQLHNFHPPRTRVVSSQ